MYFTSLSIVLLLLLSYIFVLGRYLYHWNQLAVWITPPDYHSKTKVSVVIPARNEATQIDACLNSVLSQNYPSSLFEVILIDDHSTDATYEIASSIVDQKLRILRLQDFAKDQSENSYKKKALEIGIKAASGQLILTTDADCEVPKDWILRMSHLYETKDAKFIAAPVNFYKEENLFQRFQSLDFMGMMGITGAGIKGQFMRMCNGANLGFDRQAFYEVGGYQGIDHLASGDDMLLMQKVARHYPEQIYFLKNAAATVKTLPQRTLRTFFNQRLRWASKSSDYKEWQVTAMLGIVWAYCWAIIITSVVWITRWFPDNDRILLGSTLLLLSVKLVMDFLLLRKMTRFFKRTALLSIFLPAQLMHILYIVIVGTLSLFVKKYEWKGRVVR